MILIVHEFCHALVNYIGSYEENNYKVPSWLNEGLSVLESRQLYISEWQEGIKEAVRNKEFISIEKDMANEQFAGAAYPFSGTLVKYILQTYGIEKIKELIKEPEDFEKIYEITLDDLQKEWENYLIKTYQ